MYPVRSGSEVQRCWELETLSSWPPCLGDHNWLLSQIDARVVSLTEYKEAAVMGPQEIGPDIPGSSRPLSPTLSHSSPRWQGRGEPLSSGRTARCP